MNPNRRLLISVFTPEEVREAIAGGARIIDCEDPRTSLGNISPQAIMALSETALAYGHGRNIQISTNIGEEQLLFDRGETGIAVQKADTEIAGKSAQAALGVATAMGTKVHPTNIVKIGVDAMRPALIERVLREVLGSIQRSDGLNHTQVVPVFFVRDVGAWHKRRGHEAVVRELVRLREFYPCEDGEVDLAEIGVLPQAEVDEWHKRFGTTKIALNEVPPYEALQFPAGQQDTLRVLVDVCAAAGVSGLMLDTSIQLKVARIGLLQHESNGVEEMASGPALKREGIMSLDDCHWFCDYCHWKGIEAYLAGSLQPAHAQALWGIDNLDSIAVRGGASEAVREPGDRGEQQHQARDEKRITRRMVERYVPPEQQRIEENAR